MAEMPAAEVDVDDELVAGLLRDQHPDLAGCGCARWPTGGTTCRSGSATTSSCGSPAGRPPPT